MYPKLLALALALAFVSPLAAQISDKKDPKEEAEKLRNEAIAFLRETMGDIGSLRTLENRISFTAEMAGLMWFHDEREARGMFSTAVTDFRELLARLEQQMSQFPEDEGPGGLVGRGLLGDVSGRMRVEMKYRIAMAVRQQMTSSIAEHDPDVALGFYYDTASTNPRFEKSYGYRDMYFETSLLSQIAEKNAAKAAQLAVRSLDKGINYQHIDLLRKIYEKDADKGVEFGSALISKAREGNFLPENMFAAGALLNYGAEVLEQSRTNGKKPVFSLSDLRSLADAMGRAILDKKKDEASSGLAYLGAIEQFTPSRAAQIRARFAIGRGDGDVYLGNANMAANKSVRLASNTASTVAEEIETDAVPMTNSSNANRARQEQEAKFAAEKKLMDDVASIGKGQLPKEERDRVVAQVRKILMQSQGRDKQIMGLSMLAGQVARAGDKELAAEIMRDVERLVNPNPKNYQDFIFTWMLASGYADSNPDKAFPILEDAIGRANSIISAFAQAAEFIDVSEEMISDGEAQVGAFGGGMIRGLGKELGIAEAAIGSLVKADFAKTKGLTNRFERPEIRVLAKMLVLRAVLGKKDAPTPAADGNEITVN